MSQTRHDTFNVLQSDFMDIKGTRYSIIAGHYCIAEGLEYLSNAGESEIHSFELGALSFRHLKNKGYKEVSFILWVNDIGVDVSFRKLFKESYSLPDNYLAVLDRYNIERKEVEVLFESSIRNRAMLEFRRIYKKTPDKFGVFDSSDKSLVRCINNDRCEISNIETSVYTVSDVDGSPIVMREGANVKCNLILATLLYLIEKKYNPDNIVHVCNDIYVDRVRLGEHVAKEVYHLQSRCYSYFCDEENVYAKNW